VAKVVKVLLVLAAVAFVVWLGLRVWRKRRTSH
jgi:threonine/homoserine/homoserine lactone efflux protein